MALLTHHFRSTRLANRHRSSFLRELFGRFILNLIIYSGYHLDARNVYQTSIQLKNDGWELGTEITGSHNNYWNRSGNDHIMNRAKISDSKNSIWAALPINVFKFLPWEDVSKLISQRTNTLFSAVGALIWSKQLFNISRNAFPFLELSIDAARHDSILAEWYGT